MAGDESPGRVVKGTGSLSATGTGMGMPRHISSPATVAKVHMGKAHGDSEGFLGDTLTVCAVNVHHTFPPGISKP